MRAMRNIVIAVVLALALVAGVGVWRYETRVEVRFADTVGDVMSLRGGGMIPGWAPKDIGEVTVAIDPNTGDYVGTFLLAPGITMHPSALEKMPALPASKLRKALRFPRDEDLGVEAGAPARVLVMGSDPFVMSSERRIYYWGRRPTSS